MPELPNQANTTDDPVSPALRAADPDFVALFDRLAAAATGRNALTPRMRELVQLSINASVTHLAPEALRRHLRAALRAGATREEIMEVLQLTSVLGIHSCSLGIPALVDELSQAGRPLAETPWTERQQEVKAAFTAGRGYWGPTWDRLLRLDAEFMAAYAAFSSHPWATGRLLPKERELIYVAIDCATTHLYDPGLRVHVRNALGYGASADEVMEVLKLCSLLGIQTCVLGAAILDEELGLPAA